MADKDVADRPEGSEPDNRAKPGGWLRFLPIALLFAGLVLGYAFGWNDSLTLQGLADNGEALRRLVAGNPVAAPLAFIGLYTLAAACSFPAVALLKVVGGFLFGWFPGAVYVAVAATAGGGALFLAARSAFGGLLGNRGGAGTARFAKEFERDAFSYILMLRLAPFIPFFMVSIAPALFRVRLKTYLAATVIGVLPGALCFAWLGQGLGNVVELARAEGRPIALSDLVTPEITAAFLVLTLVAVLATIVRKVRGPQAP